MDSTIQLLERAMTKVKADDPKATDASFCRVLGLNRTALGVARNRGNLSPIAAGNVAAAIGEDVEHWMAVAALEAAPKSKATDQLRRVIAAMRNS